MSEEEAEEMFRKSSEGFKDETRVADFQTVLSCSELVSESCSRYLHSPFQCYAAAMAISSHSQTRVIEMPTGSGKTWVYSILAKYYSLLGKSTTIIVPTDALRQ